MEGMEGMKPCWKQVLMEIFAFFFLWGGGERWGWKFLTDPKMAFRKHFEGLFCREANGRAPSWSTHIARCQFGALKHESLLTLIG